MQLSHRIELVPTKEQVAYFQKASGTSRFVWNWAVGTYRQQYAMGLKPKAMALKKQFNQIKYEAYPWLKEVHRDSHAQAFTYLQRSWQQFFSDVKAQRPAHEPRFKKKGRCRESFYVANDKFRVEGLKVCLPKIGQVCLTEALRYEGKILGASVSRSADRWYISIQVDIPDAKAQKQRTGDGTVGVDLGVSTAITLSSGKKIGSPKPLKQALRRIKVRGRRVSRKFKAAKIACGFTAGEKLAKGSRLSLSKNHQKSSLKLAKLHRRVSNLRSDFTHKVTTQLCRENQTIVIEDLHVKGMLANDRLARAISDIGFATIRQQLTYKTKRYGGTLVIANRWYPSSRLCSSCGWRHGSLGLHERMWRCASCHTVHDRDINAALNLKRLATLTALPVANQSVTKDTGSRKVLDLGGKVTLVRYECGLQDASGQEINREHFSSLF